MAEARDFCYYQHVQTSSDHPWSPPSLLYNGYRLYPSSKSAEAFITHPSSSAEVEERIDLYLHSPSGPSCSVIGRTLSLPLPDWPSETPSLLLDESHMIIPRECSDRSVKLTTRLCQTLSLGTGGATLELLHTFS